MLAHATVLSLHWIVQMLLEPYVHHCIQRASLVWACEADLGEFVTVLGFQIALHICHELVEAG